MNNLFGSVLEGKGKILFILSIIFSVIIIAGASFYFAQLENIKKSIAGVETIMGNDDTSLAACQSILDFDLTRAITKKASFDTERYFIFKKNCEQSYILSKQTINEETCGQIVKYNKVSLQRLYIDISGYDDVYNHCIDDVLSVQFGTGAFFDVENDFASQLNLDFSLAFLEDMGDPDSSIFLANRIDAKERILKKFSISPHIDISSEDVYFYGNRAVLSLKLEPLTTYSVHFGMKHSFQFTSPEKKYLGLIIQTPVSLFRESDVPKIKLLEYNTDKTKTSIAVCKLTNENYAKIEAYKTLSGLSEEKNNFFTKDIDTVLGKDCSLQDIDFSSEKTSGKVSLLKQEIDLSSLVGKEDKKGLYAVVFTEESDRGYNGRIQEPLLFGLIDSHITMKVSKNGDAFFFVNDFAGIPLEGQKIEARTNIYKEKNITWNNETNTEDVSYNSPKNGYIFGSSVDLGTTGKDGVLQVNLRGKVDDAFFKTFENWGDTYEGSYNSFFVKASSKDHLSFVSSRWNAGIQAWNFGYTLSSYYGENNGEKNQDVFTLDQWGSEVPPYYAHIYTDRALYLPNETVHIKGVVRKSTNLSIPDTQDFTLIVTDSNGKQILSKKVKLNQYGSLLADIELQKDSSLGTFNISLQQDDLWIASSAFSVEVFKNPKYANEISIETDNLNGENIKITHEEKGDYPWDTKYAGDFTLTSQVFSKYFSGPAVSNTPFSYKVYKQVYYDNTYWGDCYYGCYYEGEKELYTEGTGILDANGYAKFQSQVAFSSTYDDYKYIVEVTVTDNAGEQISSSNSIVVRLPSEYKKWASSLSLHFDTEKRFYEVGKPITIEGNISNGKWIKEYNNSFLLIVKQKKYTVKKVNDVRGYVRPITEVKEDIKDILFVNDTNFKISSDGNLTFSYTPKDSGEYVFEYGKIDKEKYNFSNLSIEQIVKKFKEENLIEIREKVKQKVVLDAYGENLAQLSNTCFGTFAECNTTSFLKHWGCDNEFDMACVGKEREVEYTKNIKLSSLLSPSQYFTILTYGDNPAQNPEKSDNKIQVLSEKVSYNYGEKARVLVRLPFENGKVLWTIEKAGVIEYEYIDVKGNTFFKEVSVDDRFVPNAYIGVVAVDTRNQLIPEYKVGYTEIVVDKTDKKADINIKINAEVYAPRDFVEIELSVKNNKGKALQSELSVMVVDDSLISLMGNVDTNILEKMYRKLSFQTQTSITNLAMLVNYYFSRPGIVGGSGFSNLKGGDSSVSSRNIFKNTAFYTGSIITDNNGKAKVRFTLPDNLTNFRVIAVSNSKDNYFGQSESFITVRKDVIIEDRTPLILRDGDRLTIGANVFNNTEDSQTFKVVLASKEMLIDESEKNVTILPGKSEYVSFGVEKIPAKGDVHYTIQAIGKTQKQSDMIEGTIRAQSLPTLFQNIYKTEIIPVGKSTDMSIGIPTNTLLSASSYNLVLSNNPLNGIETILKSLLVYPYGCIEQTTSTTLPNAILFHLGNLLEVKDIPADKIQENVNTGLKSIISMQTENGGFSYWEGDPVPNLHITPYVLRTLIDMQKMGVDVDQHIIEKARTYLEEQNFSLLDAIDRGEIYWALAKAGTSKKLLHSIISPNTATSTWERHSLLAYTYGLLFEDKYLNEGKINENISYIQKKLQDESTDWYRNSNSDLGIFASLLIDFDYREMDVETIIGNLYSYDWDSYYYSTQAKNNAFIAFSKYIEKYGAMRENSVEIILNGKKEILTLNGNNKKFVKNVDVSLVQDMKIPLSIKNVSGKNIFASISFKGFPKDTRKIKEESNNMTITREIYEVKNDTSLMKCKNSYYSYYDEDNQNGDCEEALKQVEKGILQVGKTYKIKIIAKFDSEKNRKNVTLEDYLPSSFRVLNSNFNTTSVAVKSGNNNWSWEHNENFPGLTMVYTSQLWSSEATYEYYITPEFKGTFVYPPVNAYLMYDTSTNAHSEFQTLTVE